MVIDTKNAGDMPTEGRNYHVYSEVVEDGMFGNVYTDQMGHFLVLSSWGHKYLFLIYYYDRNSILTDPTKSR